jgi:hypothetical protein
MFSCPFVAFLYYYYFPKIVLYCFLSIQIPEQMPFLHVAIHIVLADIVPRKGPVVAYFMGTVPRTARKDRETTENLMIADF